MSGQLGQMATGLGGSQSLGAYAQQLASPTPQPTDMQTHIQRAREVVARLANIHCDLLGVVGRLYGEGQSAGSKEPPAAPHPAGLSHEMTLALSNAETVIEHIQAVVCRLSQHA